MHAATAIRPSKIAVTTRYGFARGVANDVYVPVATACAIAAANAAKQQPSTKSAMVGCGVWVPCPNLMRAAKDVIDENAMPCFISRTPYGRGTQAVCRSS